MKKLSFKVFQKQHIELSNKALNKIKGGSVVNFLEIQNGGTLTGISSSTGSTNG